MSNIKNNNITEKLKRIKNKLHNTEEENDNHRNDKEYNRIYNRNKIDSYDKDAKNNPEILIDIRKYGEYIDKKKQKKDNNNDNNPKSRSKSKYRNRSKSKSRNRSKSKSRGGDKSLNTSAINNSVNTFEEDSPTSIKEHARRKIKDNSLLSSDSILSDKFDYLSEKNDSSYEGGFQETYTGTNWYNIENDSEFLESNYNNNPFLIPQCGACSSKSIESNEEVNQNKVGGGITSKLTEGINLAEIDTSKIAQFVTNYKDTETLTNFMTEFMKYLKENPSELQVYTDLLSRFISHNPEYKSIPLADLSDFE